MYGARERSWAKSWTSERPLSGRGLCVFDPSWRGGAPTGAASHHPAADTEGDLRFFQRGHDNPDYMSEQLPHSLRRLTARVTVAALALLCGVASSSAAPPVADARCGTAAQSIVGLRGIGCAEAKRVAVGAQQALGSLPECVGDVPKRYRGWLLRGPGATDRDQALQTRFSKGSKRFRLIGGGEC